jgi:hypothetical protein
VFHTSAVKLRIELATAEELEEIAKWVYGPPDELWGDVEFIDIGAMP